MARTTIIIHLYLTLPANSAGMQSQHSFNEWKYCGIIWTCCKFCKRTT